MKTKHLSNSAVLPCPTQKHLQHNIDVRQKAQNQHLWHNTKRAIFLHSGGLKPVLTVVISHWSGQRGEFPVLHHSDGCVQLHYARAAGSPGCWGRSSSGLIPLVQGLRPRFMGQGLVRTQARLLANGSSWSAAAVRQVIYRWAGWREC